MKKVILAAVCLTFGVSTISAQSTDIEIRNFLPEKGQWAIGTDVLPLFNSVGNIFYDNQGEKGFGSSSFRNLINPNVTLLGKYMISDEIAVRLNLGVMSNTTTIRNQVPDLANPAPENEVEDVVKKRIGGFMATMGAEYRLGKKRVQGVFGADVLIGCYSMTDIFEYGNAITESNPGDRTLKERAANQMTLGLQATAGIEVFVAQGIAIGGQVNLGYYSTMGGKTFTTHEKFDTALGAVKEWTDNNKQKVTSSSFATNNVGGALYLMFYF